MIRTHLPLTFSLGAAVLAGAALWGCGHPVQETAAHKIADALPTLLGPAAHYEVQVDSDTFALARGRARAVHIQGQAVQLSPSLTLDTLNADASEVSFDTKTRRIEHIGRTQFSATLGQANLTRYLSQVKAHVPSLVVTLREREVEAQVPVSAFGLQTTAALSGTLAPDVADPSKLDFVANRVHVGIIPLPAGLVNLALDQLNPLISLSGLKAPLTITEAGVENSRLTLKGTADLNGLVRPL